MHCLREHPSWQVTNCFMYISTKWSVLHLLKGTSTLYFLIYQNVMSFPERKNWKTLFEPNVRIITWKERLRKLWGLFHPSEVKTQFKFFETEGCTLNDILLTGLHHPDLSAILVGHVTPYKTKKECRVLRNCLVDAMSTWLVEPVFLLIEVWFDA